MSKQLEKMHILMGITHRFPLKLVPVANIFKNITFFPTYLRILKVRRRLDESKPLQRKRGGNIIKRIFGKQDKQMKFVVRRAT